MVKIVRILILALLLAGCTSSQLRSISSSLGFHKVSRVFPVDLSDREKQVFRIRGLEKPSMLVHRSDGTFPFSLNLCMDSIPGVSIEVFKGFDVDLKLSMDEGPIDYVYTKNGTTHTCWWADNSEGIELAVAYLPTSADFNKPITIDFQLKDDRSWSLLAKSHKQDPSGNTPIIEIDVNDVKNKNRRAMSKLKNPRIVIWTGD